jgi:hypothetical protein
VARVWLYKDMMELQRKFVPEAYHHMLADTPRKLAAKRAREVAEKLSSAPSTPSVRLGAREKSSVWESGDNMRWGSEAEAETEAEGDGGQAASSMSSKPCPTPPLHLEHPTHTHTSARHSEPGFQAPVAVWEGQRPASVQARGSAGVDALAQHHTLVMPQEHSAAPADAERGGRDEGGGRGEGLREAAGGVTCWSEAAARAAAASLAHPHAHPPRTERSRLGVQAPSVLPSSGDAAIRDAGAGAGAGAVRTQEQTAGGSSAAATVTDATARSRGGVVGSGSGTCEASDLQHGAVAGGGYAFNWRRIKGWLLTTGAATGQAFFWKLVGLSAYLVAAVLRRGGGADAGGVAGEAGSVKVAAGEGSQKPRSGSANEGLPARGGRGGSDVHQDR